MVSGDSPGGVSEMKLSLEVEEGEFVLRNVEMEVMNGGEFNPFVSLASLAKGVHLLDLVPMLLKPVFQLMFFCNMSWMIAWVWLFLETCNRMYYLEGTWLSPIYSWFYLRGNVLMKMWVARLPYRLFCLDLQLE